MSNYAFHLPLSMQFGNDDHAIQQFMRRDCPNKSKPKGPKQIGKVGMRDAIERPGKVVVVDPFQFMQDREAGLV